MKEDYILGLDLGTNSIGWACINEEKKQILDGGVRIFDAAENPKTGESLAKPRRDARLLRRRLHHRHTRMQGIASLLVEYHFIESVSNIKTSICKNIWELRVQALDEKLSDLELSHVIYYINKYRGFKSSRKSEIDENEELQKSNKCMKDLEDDFKESGYRTIGEYLYNTYHKSHIKNKFGSYTHQIYQDLNEKELNLILKTQKEKGNTLINDAFEEKLFSIFTYRRGLPSFENMVGECNLETNHKRAPKDALSSYLFRAYQDLNNLRYSSNKEVLSLDQRHQLIDLAFTKEKPTETQIAKIINVAVEEIETKDPKDNKKTKKQKSYLMNFDIKKINNSLTFKSYHKMKKVLEKLNIWDLFEKDLEKKDYTKWDSLVYAISFLKEYKNLEKLEDKQIKEKIDSLNLSPEILKELFSYLNFNGTMGHSLQAMWKLLPCFEKDKNNIPYTYYDCIEEIYPGKFNSTESQNLDEVPKIDVEDIPNPVVRRTLNQTRLLINKLIKVYGKPSQINIELARDLGKNWFDRKKLEKNMKENQIKNEENYHEAHDNKISDLVAYRLWKEQSGVCLYSGKPISIQDLRCRIVEVDHILPISRSLDDSLSNKVLVFASENQKKGNKTAFEYMQSKGEQELEKYKIRIKDAHISYFKKQHLLYENFDEKNSQEYKSRHLNDSRYIARTLTQHLEKTIRPKDYKGKYVKTIAGQATSVLRKLWQFGDKDRQKSHTHHGMDALLIAGAGTSIQKDGHDITLILQHSDKIKGKSLGEIAKKNINRFNFSIPLPWENFADNAQNYMDHIMVSRLGKKKITGEMHKQTILSKRDHTVVKTVHLETCGKTETEVLKKLDKMIDITISIDGVKGRNAFLYKIIKEHAQKYNWDMALAFNAENAPFMPSKKTNPKRVPQIRKIKIFSTANSELILKNMSSPKRKAAVDNSDIIRLDLFQNSQKAFEIVPVYAFHTKVLPEPNDKNSRFIFSIYKNDYLKFEKDKLFSNGVDFHGVKNKEEYFKKYPISKKNPDPRKEVPSVEGYFVTRGNTVIVIAKHDISQGLYQYQVTFKHMNNISKYYIDILGRKHFIADVSHPEKERLSLSQVDALWNKKE